MSVAKRARGGRTSGSFYDFENGYLCAKRRDLGDDRLCGACRDPGFDIRGSFFSEGMPGAKRGGVNGRTDGVKAGRSDCQRGSKFNFASHADYKNGLRGYDPKLGNRKAYKREYRSAYENGYREGWNGY